MACKALSDFGASLGKARQNLIRSIKIVEPFTEEAQEFLVESEEKKILVLRSEIKRSGDIGEVTVLLFPLLSGAVGALDGRCPLRE